MAFVCLSPNTSLKSTSGCAKSVLASLKSPWRCHTIARLAKIRWYGGPFSPKTVLWNARALAWELKVTLHLRNVRQISNGVKGVHAAFLHQRYSRPYARLSNGNFCILTAASLNDAELYHGIERVNMAFSIDDRAELKCFCQLSLSLLDASLFEPRSGHAHRQPYRFGMRGSTDMLPQLKSSALKFFAFIEVSLRLRDLARSSMASIEVTLLSPSCRFCSSLGAGT